MRWTTTISGPTRVAVGSEVRCFQPAREASRYSTTAAGPTRRPPFRKESGSIHSTSGSMSRVAAAASPRANAS